VSTDINALIFKLWEEAQSWAECHSWPGWPPLVPETTLYGQAATALEELRAALAAERERANLLEEHNRTVAERYDHDDDFQDRWVDKPLV